MARAAGVLPTFSKEDDAIRVDRLSAELFYNRDGCTRLHSAAGNRAPAHPGWHGCQNVKEGVAPERTVSPEERELKQMAGRYMPGSGLCNVSTGMTIREGRGVRVWDFSVDYPLGSGPMLVGHAHPVVVSAIGDLIGRGTTFFADNEHAIRLAMRIVEAVPCAANVRSSSTRSEATLYAMRAARARGERDEGHLM